MDKYLYEKRLIADGVKSIAGVDEVGRGCLAGSVYAAAVILPYPCNIDGITDSKKITPKKRDLLFDLITERALAIGIGIVDAEEIDRINILQASLLAMKKAVDSLEPRPGYLLVDGSQQIPITIPQLTITKGDDRSLTIGAASIIAKVTRDRYMAEMEKEFMGFAFGVHKGYGTKKHMEEIRQHGPTPIHRKTFKGVLK